VLDSVRDEMPTIRNPAWRPWRSQRARALAALGEREEAVRLVEDELVLARRWGTPGLVGGTLRCLGEVLGAQGIGCLREAVHLLARSPRRLEEAHARASLASALLRHGDDDGRSEARRLLERGLRLADQCDAQGLRHEVASSLRELGVDVPTDRSPLLTLTAAERRIAKMAADGMDPGDIAQAVFVTRHTVSTTLAEVTRRLGVSSPEDLRSALGSAAP
jgi:DNA-binding CsgD family transcriptional regulator